MVPSQTHFQNAHHFEVKDGQFINIANVANSIIIANPTNDLVWTTLAQHVAAGAMFDSAERYPPGKCHPGTRKTITRKIREWIDDPAAIQSILWVFGPAGAGKSALAQSICEFLAQSDSDRYGASFFFSKGHRDRGDALKLITTLSYQVAVRFPGVRSEINKALMRDPILLNKSMEIQMLSLIIEPIVQCKEFPSHRPVIVIDGLDECADDESASTQRNIISLIAKSILDYRLPLRFMVFSRPEYWIRDVFDIPPLPEIMLPLSLRQTFEADKDIETYLIDGFEQIRRENKRVMGSVGLPWPSTDVIKRLVYEASGQFIYASTVLKFVGKYSRFSNPKEQLRIITSHGPHRASAFSELDRLYAAILSAYPRWGMMKRVLGGLLNYPYAVIAKVFLGVDADELVLVLDALSSLLDITKPDLTQEELDLASVYGVDPDSLLADRDKIVFCHLSFREFLEDEARSGAFYIDASGYRDEIARAFFGVIHRNIDSGYQTEPHLLLNIDWNTYSFVMENVTYPSKTSMWCSGINTMLPLITHMSEKLVLPDAFYTRKSMNSLTKFMQDLTLLERHPKTPVSGVWKEIGYIENEGTQPAWKMFTDAVFLAQKRAMYALTLLPEFEVTPVFVSMLDVDYWDIRFTRLSDNSIMNDCPWFLYPIYEVQSEFMDSIKQNRHILTLSYSVVHRRWSLTLADLDCLFAIWGTVNPRFKNEWKEQQNFIARSLIESVFSHDLFSDVHYGMIARKIAKLKSISSENDLQNTSQVSALLECVGSLSNRICPLFSKDKLRSYPHIHQLIMSVICWLDRQLTSLQALKISQDHNEGLLQRLTETINYLFKEFFLRNFLESYDNRLRSRSQDRVVKLRPAALPQGFRIHEEGSDPFRRSSHLEQILYNEAQWPIFHNQIFREMDGTTERLTPSFISPSCWHPHLASLLLNTLVEYLYGGVHPSYSIFYNSNAKMLLNVKNSLSYITECLPFAFPTLENLDALRLIVYLYPKVTDKSAILEVLPGDLWHSISGFLKKYDRSLLSSEELELFELWLHSTDHGEINKYIKR